jgi:DNA-directed RNA polymerase subunit RPC12/RpoP
MNAEQVKCDGCGQMAQVVTWTPIYARQRSPDGESQAEAPERSCVIRCPQCGMRTQIVSAETN